MNVAKILEEARGLAPRIHPLTRTVGSLVIYGRDGRPTAISQELYEYLGILSGTGTILCDDPVVEAKLNTPEMRERWTLSVYAMMQAQDHVEPGVTLSTDLLLGSKDEFLIEEAKQDDDGEVHRLRWLPDPA